MNKHKIIGLYILLVFIAGCSSVSKNEKLDSRNFTTPQVDSKVHTWWHWVDGMISKEGITKDLESMKEQGIVQATILNLGFKENEGWVPGDKYHVEKVKFVTDEWYDMFNWAVQEANRLGITIGVHNCDGWSESGGPWITPEMSMKKFVYTKTLLESGYKGMLKLDKPYCNHDYYEEVAVIAYKNGGLKKNSFQEANPEILLSNHRKVSPSALFELKKGDTVAINFDKEFVTNKIAIFQGFKGGTSTIRTNSTNEYTVLYSRDGKDYKKLDQFKDSTYNDMSVINFKKTKAKFFKIIVSDGLYISTWRDNYYLLSNIELLADDDNPGFATDIPYVFDKTNTAKIMDNSRLVKTAEVSEDKVIKEGEIINLTDKIDEDGIVDLDLPEGSWTVLRFGYTTNGVISAPATIEGEGLECDKLDTTALNLHFASYGQKLVDHSNGLNGSTFKFLLIDSWECDFQNWTAKMPEEFEKRRGYSLINWLPALCGDVVGSQEMSNGFLYDFRKTIADMLEENYYLHFKDLCHRNKLEIHAEVIYGGGKYPPLDILRTNSQMDLPMTEFWTLGKDGLIVYEPLKENQMQGLISMASLYDKPVLASEAYTAGAHHSENPSDLKLYGDRAYCAGINQMILHSYVHQPNEQKPGMTLYCFGSHFNRHTPWWNYANGWLDYQSRVQYMLKRGFIPAQVLYYIGDQLPQDLYAGFVGKLPKGIQANVCNLDLLQKAKVQNGKIVFPTGAEFAVLVLPKNRSVNLSTLKEVERLANEGAVIYGNKPEILLSLSDQTEKREESEELINKLWANYEIDKQSKNEIGKGSINWGIPINDLLIELNVEPSFQTNLPDSLDVLATHKSTENEDIFFIVNQQQLDLNFEADFKVGEMIPEVWDPMTGDLQSQLVYIQTSDKVKIPVSIDAGKSLFIVFKKGSQKEHVVAIEKDGVQVFPTTDMVSSFELPELQYTENTWSIVSKAAGNYKVTLNTEEQLEFASEASEEYSIVNFSGKMEFNSIKGDTISPIQISNLKSLTEFEQSKIKFFSGEVRYTIDFDVPANMLDGNGKLELDLGEFDHTGEIKLNGQFLTNVWTSNVAISVNGILKEHNQLEVLAATTNRNRLVGDRREHGPLQGLWTSFVGLGADSSLDPCGLRGPLQIIKYPEVTNED